MKRRNILLLAFVICLLTGSCKKHEQPALSGNQEICSSFTISTVSGKYLLAPAIPNTSKINVPQFSYVENFSTFTFIGDSTVFKLPGSEMPSNCCEAILYLSKLSPTPGFSWFDTGDSIVACAIFKGRVSVEDSKRLNAVNAVWMWNSGLQTGNHSGGKVFVQYSDGRPVVNGIIQQNSDPVPLELNQTYTWLVWTWDNQGINIVKSSFEIPFMVGRGVLPVVSLSDTSTIIGSWVLSEAMLSNGTDITSSYSIRKILFHSTASVELIKSDSSKVFTQMLQINNGNIILNSGVLLNDVMINCQAFSAYIIIPGDTSEVATGWTRF